MYAGLAFVLAGCNATPLVTTLQPRPEFEAAKVQWEAEYGVMSGALQGAPLLIAILDLQLGLSTHSSGTSHYKSVISAIRSFERIPLTSVTPAQRRQAAKDVAFVNSFFGIGHAQLVVLARVPSGPGYIAAKKGWEREPPGIEDGVDVPHLMDAVAALERASSKHPVQALLNAAAISDLRDLESATATDIASIRRNPDSRIGAEVAFLNSFFSHASIHYHPVFSGAA
jgi:hypothetical protein